MKWVLVAALVCGAGAAFAEDRLPKVGAHAAHGLEDMLTNQGLAEEDVLKRLSQCEVAVRYHLIHVVALLAIGASTSRRAASTKSLAAFFMLLGVALFCGGLWCQCDDRRVLRGISNSQSVSTPVW